MKKPKLTIVLRTDLNMGTGKMIAQAGHAIVQALRLDCEEEDGKRDEMIVSWVAQGMKKVTLQVASEAELLALRDKANLAKVPITFVHDAGLTQVAAGTVTCCAVGPDNDKRIERVTGSLKLLD